MLDFDVEKAVRHVREINPKIEIIKLSAKTSSGMDKWLEYLRKLVPSARGEYELPDAINMMISDGLLVASVQMGEAPWLDIGTPEDLATAELRLSEGTL